MTILDFIVFVVILGTVAYFAYRSGFEEGQAAANRKHTQLLSRLRNENGILDKRTCDLYNQIDEIKERLETAEFKLKRLSNMIYGSRAFQPKEPPVYKHGPSGQVVGTVVGTEENEGDLKAKIITSDMLDNAVKNQWETVKVMSEED